MMSSAFRLAPVAALLLAACAHAPRERAPQSAGSPGPAASAPVVAPAAAPAPLPPPPAFAPPAALSPRNASQVVHAAFGARVATLRTAVQLDAAGLKVVGVTASGMRVFTATWDGERVSAERGPFVPKEVSPERVLADMQLALWPLDSLQHAYAGSGHAVAEPFPGLRRLSRGGQLIAEVHYASPDPWDGRLWFVNFEFGYSLTIDTSPN
jgi:hypothetical protein